jgi:mannosyltransferase
MGATERPGRRAPTRAAVLALLACAIAVGALLRFHELDARSLWNDELSSWAQSHYSSLAEVIERGVRPTPYPPGYQILLYFVERGAGDSEVALRMPSAIAGVLAIAAMFLLGREVYGEREGLLGAALLAVSYQPLYYSQEARAYSLLLLFAIVSSTFWLRIREALAQGALRPGAVTGYLLSAGVMMYLHYFGLLLAATQVGGLVALSATRPRALARVAGLGVALGALYLPWLPYFVEEFAAQPLYLPEPGLNSLALYWRGLFYNPGDWLKWVVAAVLLAALARWAWGRRRESAPRASWRSAASAPTTLLLGWLLIPLGFAFVRSLTSAPIFDNRNLIITLPAAYLLLARAITALAPRPLLQLAAAALYAAVMLQGIFVTGAYYRFPRKEQFREAAAIVARYERDVPGAPVVAHAFEKSYFDYYLERLGASSRVDLLAGTAQDVDRLAAFLAREHPRHLWLLSGHLSLEEAFVAYLDRDFEPLAHETLFGASATLYQRRDGG